MFSIWESEAEQCGWVVVNRCQDWPLRNFLMYLSGCMQFYKLRYRPARRLTWTSVDHLCEGAKKYLVSFPIFSVAKPEQSNIKPLCMHCGWLSSITSQSWLGPIAFSFPFPSLFLSLFPSLTKLEVLCRCTVEVQCTVEYNERYHIIRLALRSEISSWGQQCGLSDLCSERLSVTLHGPRNYVWSFL